MGASKPVQFVHPIIHIFLDEIHSSHLPGIYPYGIKHFSQIRCDSSSGNFSGKNSATLQLLDKLGTHTHLSERSTDAVYPCVSAPYYDHVLIVRVNVTVLSLPDSRVLALPLLKEVHCVVDALKLSA